MWKTTIFALLCVGMISVAQVRAADTPLRLHYDESATDWMTEALPIGNGYMGAMFFGDPREEHIQFSEGSLWAGGPGSHPDYNFGNREGAAAHLKTVRAQVRAGKFDEAHKTASQHLTGIIHKKEGSDLDYGDFGAQQTMGDLYVAVELDAPVTAYHRSLNLDAALGHVSYQTGDVHHERTFFGSYPHRALVYRFENDHATGTTYTFRLETPHTVDSWSQEGNIIRLKGHVQDNGLEFETRVVVQTDGTLVAGKNGRFLVTGARTLTLYHFAHTAYQNSYPTYRGTDFVAKNDAVQQGLESVNYESVRQAHIADYQALFNRVSLWLGDVSASDATTDARLRAYQAGGEDAALEVLLFQYARYLMIAASRPGAMPMHLQGKWNNSTDPIWASDYHSNINLQMLYWPAEVTNLPECHVPLLDYTAGLVEPGRVSAKTHFGTQGWIVNTMNNAFGFTAPGWGFPSGFFPGGAGWLCQHLWEHYAYTGDEDYLREQAYPVMKEAGLFWIDYLQENTFGKLVSIPSYSPENGGISAGASMDHQIAWDLLNNCVKAAAVLGIDDEFTRTALRVRDQINKPSVGRWGQLQEWFEDIDDVKNQHRHVSHLFALYPGAQINVTETPEWAKAAQVSLNARGDGGTGWSLAWKVCFWARLRDGDRAHQLLRNFLQLTATKGFVSNKAGGVYQNLLCAHPPFQLDGNMGASAGMAEMRLQSHADEIHLLPALPTQWKAGKVTGLVARGGHEVDIAWKDGQLTTATIHNPNGATVRYGNKTLKFPSERNEITLSAASFAE
ncbi:MAG: glycoside hydrolase N-terminal domain-containing protein [Candidatus Hydrogenedentes bacterium]|nr:glycoside hydrolase N-terminal domain-containing protein [Candidatus Hydrogenedentota bacterium]